MSRLTGFADLLGRQVGLFGVGVEGRAAAERLRTLGLTPVLVDDTPLDDGVLATSQGGLEALFACDVVLKSPGIPRRREDVLALEAAGVLVTSALNLWMGDVDRHRVLGVTGSKGKSTTTSLISFFLTCLGESAQALGNIGIAPYDPAVDTSSGWLVVEISSFQCTDLRLAPATLVITALGEDHVDWHGSVAQYREDKLSIARRPGPHRTFVPDVAIFHEYRDLLGEDVVFVTPDASDLAEALGLLGEHSHANVALALASVAHATGRAIAEVFDAVRARAHEFQPLRGRLTLVADEDYEGLVRYVDDGLATSALPTVAALEVFADERVALLCGGFDRGVDYTPLLEALTARRRPTTLLAMGPAGRRVATLLAERESPVTCVAATTMAEAVAVAREAVRGGGVVLLSPAAPSFDAYRNWLERSEDFTASVRTLLG